MKNTLLIILTFISINLFSQIESYRFIINTGISNSYDMVVDTKFNLLFGLNSTIDVRLNDTKKIITGIGYEKNGYI